MDETKKEVYLTVKELAGYLNLSEPTIRRHVLNEEIPFHKIMGSIRFRLSEIENWVESKKEESRVDAEAEGVKHDGL